MSATPGPWEVVSERWVQSRYEDRHGVHRTSKRRRPGFACLLCGYGGEAGSFWLLFGPGLAFRGISLRWPRRKRVYRECPECWTMQTAQSTARDVLEWM